LHANAASFVAGFFRPFKARQKIIQTIILAGRIC
jgi:hypothetical protein